MTDREAMQMALEALESFKFAQNPLVPQSIYVLRKALAQPEQEPVREHNKIDFRCECCGYMTYHREHLGCIRAATPPSKPWVSLTDEEIDYIWGISPGDYEDKFAFPRAIEAALRSKNDPTSN